MVIRCEHRLRRQVRPDILPSAGCVRHALTAQRSELSRFVASGRLHCTIDKVNGVVETNRPSVNSIANSLNHFAALCNGNATTYPTDLVAALRASSRPISCALNSERTRLSGTATDLITTAATALGSAFEPLIPHYLPTLFILCTRTNKVFLNRASTRLIWRRSRGRRRSRRRFAPLLLMPTLPCGRSRGRSSTRIRFCCLGGFRGAFFSGSADIGSNDVCYGSFTDPLTPRTRKYLDIKATTAAPSSQPPSRPTSSQSIRSNHSDTRPQKSPPHRRPPKARAGRPAKSRDGSRSTCLPRTTSHPVLQRQAHSPRCLPRSCTSQRITRHLSDPPLARSVSFELMRQLKVEARLRRMRRVRARFARRCSR